jgi:hypothetical protein
MESDKSIYETNQTLNSSNLSSDETESKAFDMSSYETYQETISLSKNSSSNTHRRVRFVTGTKVLDGPSPLFASWDRLVWDICSGLFGNPLNFPIEKSNTETGGIFGAILSSLTGKRKLEEYNRQDGNGRKEEEGERQNIDMDVIEDGDWDGNEDLSRGLA